MSDYVPDLDDLALDYGPMPDSDAARDYAKALDYDNLARSDTAPYGAAEQDEPSEPDHGPDSGTATTDGLVHACAATLDSRPAPVVASASGGPGLARVLAAAPVPATVLAPAATPAPVPATGLTAAPVPVPVPVPVPEPEPGPAYALRAVPAREAAAAPYPAQVPAPYPAQVPGPAWALEPAVPASGPAIASGLASPPAEGPAPVPGPGSASDPAQGQVAPAEDDPWVGDPAAQVSSATYWRRRLVALIAGIVVLTVLVWAVSGMLQGSGPSQAPGHRGRASAGPGGTHQGGDGSRSGQHDARHTGGGSRGASGGIPQSLPGAARGRAQTTSARTRHPGMLSGIVDVLTLPGSRQRGGFPERLTSQRAAVGTAAAHTPLRPAAARTPEHRAAAPAPGPHIAACARGDVVLSLVSPRIWYQRGRWPLFGVDAVSTGSRPCRFNMGAKFATVVVSSGRARIWGSADCVRGTGSQLVTLSRGMPAVRWIYWDRATSSPGCRLPRRNAPRGAYTAIAFDGQLSTPVMVFMLDRPGTALP